MIRGRWFVIAALLLAVAAGLGNLAYQNQRFRRARDFWGLPAATAIARESRIELWTLEPLKGNLASSASRTWTSGTTIYVITARHDVSQAPGVTHLRRALLDGASFAWDDVSRPAPVDSKYALAIGPASEVVIGLTADGGHVGTSDARWISVAPQARAFREFCERNVATAER